MLIRNQVIYRERSDSSVAFLSWTHSLLLQPAIPARVFSLSLDLICDTYHAAILVWNASPHEILELAVTYFGPQRHLYTFPCAEIVYFLIRYHINDTYVMVVMKRVTSSVKKSPLSVIMKRSRSRKPFSLMYPVDETPTISFTISLRVSVWVLVHRFYHDFFLWLRP